MQMFDAFNAVWPMKTLWKRRKKNIKITHIKIVSSKILSIDVIVNLDQSVEHKTSCFSFK